MAGEMPDALLSVPAYPMIDPNPPTRREQVPCEEDPLLLPYDENFSANKLVRRRIIRADVCYPPDGSCHPSVKVKMENPVGSPVSSNTSFHTPRNQNIAAAVKGDSFEKVNTHDVIAAYVISDLVTRENEERRKGPAPTDEVVEEALKLLTCKDGLLGSDVLSSTRECAAIVFSDSYEAYKAMHNQQVDFISPELNLSLEYMEVWVQFEAFLFAWLVEDKHAINWDRIVIILEYLCQLINTVLTFKQMDGLKRMMELVQMTTVFFDIYINASIDYMGGWSAIIGVQNVLRKRGVHDIPKAFAIEQFDEDDSEENSAEETEQQKSDDNEKYEDAA